ncbi:MAG: alpha/beta hydrolase [Methanomassiliicoccaceae archaeon]|jgi:pimeloyl-ACP methyl ester carboxylesterase|nr:alpha/beta hydrolase [Methanomassiliicoccaceae archaeon]
MPTADVNGQKINYEVKGEGIPVVLVPGMGTDTTFWDVLIPLLPGYKTVTIDNRGAGKTKHNGKITMTGMADDVAALLDHLSIFRAHMVGWSMGGCIVTEFSIKHPERVLSLTLISPYMRRPSRSSFAMAAAMRAVKEGADIEVLSMIVQVMCFPESVFLKREEKGIKGSKTPFGSTIDGIVDQMEAVDAYDGRSRPSCVSVPSLCIHGLSDIMVPPEVGDWITSQIKGCKAYRVPGAGHIINPSTYHKVMLEHFKQNE